MKSLTPSYWPTVLIVDDEANVIDTCREGFHVLTSVGVVVARDLREARQIIDDKSICVSAPNSSWKLNTQAETVRG